MFSTMRRACVAVAACAALVVGVGASPASATLAYYTISAKTIAPGQPWAVGPAHSITSNLGFVAGSLCVGAIDVYGGNLSGEGYCGNYGGTNVEHPYCGCVLRDGAVYPNGLGSGTVYVAYESY